MPLTDEQVRERAAMLADPYQVEEGIVVDVTVRDDGVVSVTWNETGLGAGGWSLSFPYPDQAIRPIEIGDRIRVLGRIGRPFHGVDINYEPLFFITEEEMQARLERSRVELDERRKREFSEKEAELDASFATLPEVFRDRIEKFRLTKPDWRWQYESYEMSACVDAVKIASTLEGEVVSQALSNNELWDKIKEITDLSWSQIKERIPGVSDAHSGNSWAVACMLAYYSLTDPWMVVAAHGAMTPIVGCVDYGCPHPMPDHLLQKYAIPTSTEVG